MTDRREAAAQRRANVRRETRLARTESAARAIGTIRPGDEVLILTHGQFSMIDALTHLLTQTGPAAVSVSTWTAASADLTHAERFLHSGVITSLRFLVDRSFQTRHPAYCATLIDLFGVDSVRTTRVHAKFATIRNDTHDLAIRTSMNLNENPRLETIEISADSGLADFLDAQFDEFFAQPAGDLSDGAMPSPKRSGDGMSGVTGVGRVNVSPAPRL